MGLFDKRRPEQEQEAPAETWQADRARVASFLYRARTFNGTGPEDPTLTVKLKPDERAPWLPPAPSSWNRGGFPLSGRGTREASGSGWRHGPDNYQVTRPTQALHRSTRETSHSRTSGSCSPVHTRLWTGNTPICSASSTSTTHLGPPSAFRAGTVHRDSATTKGRQRRSASPSCWALPASTMRSTRCSPTFRNSWTTSIAHTRLWSPLLPLLPPLRLKHPRKPGRVRRQPGSALRALRPVYQHSHLRPPGLRQTLSLRRRQRPRAPVLRNRQRG